jgi:hypothetical protein
MAHPKRPMRNTQLLDRGKPEHEVNASKSRWYAPSPEEPDEEDHPLRLFLTVWNPIFLSRYRLGDGIRYVVLRKFGSGSTGNFANAEQDLTFSSTILLNAKPDAMKFTSGSAFERRTRRNFIQCGMSSSGSLYHWIWLASRRVPSAPRPHWSAMLWGDKLEESSELSLPQSWFVWFV